MSNQRKKKGILFLAGLGVAAIVLLFANLSPGIAGGGPAGASGAGSMYQAATDAPAGYGPAGFQHGGTGQGAAPREVNMDSLPQASPRLGAPVIEHLRPLDGLTDEQYAAKKAEATRGGIPPGKIHNAAPAVPGESVSPSIGAGTAFIAQQEVCCTPSDHALAVGENFVVQFINTYIAVYNKNGVLQPGYPKSADTFFGLPSGTYTTDPRGFYDWVNHRFIFVMLTESSPNSGTNTGSLMVAASQRQDPRGSWWVYNNFVSFPAGECPDYPTLGHDSNNWGTGATKGGFYISINEFGGTGHCKGSGFIGTYTFFTPKDPIYVGAGYNYWFFTNLFVSNTNVDTIQPANMTDRSDHPATIFLVNSFNMLFGNPANGLEIWTVSGPAASPNNPFAFLNGGAGPTLTGIFMGSAHNYSFPPSADEPNGSGGVCSNCIDSGDRRITGAVKYHAGELFGALETGVATSPATAHPIWFDVHPVLNNSTSIITGAEERQEDCFVCGGQGANGSASFATMQPDQENNLLMLYEYSDDASYPGVAYTSRRVTYGDNLMNGVGFYLASGSAFYAQLCNGSGKNCRWGDYTATAPDVTTANYTRMWFAGMYANSSGNWGTEIGAASYHFPSDQ